MNAEFRNAYEDRDRALAYSRLGLSGTYYLAYRDLPEIIARHVQERRALDFGCGAGRSTRFLKQLGFETVGVDISEEMLEAARANDPDGEYLRVSSGDLRALAGGAFDLITAIFPFDNIPGEMKVPTCRELARLLAPSGRLLILVARAETYRHEWVSFSTREFPENLSAKNGDTVRVVVLDMPDSRPVEDVLWSGDAYRATFAEAGLELIRTYRPLGRNTDPFEWVTEAKIAPWAIHVLRLAGDSPESPVRP